MLGFGFTLAVVIGGTIGIGILRSPAIIAAHTGSAPGVILLWILGGVYALIGAAAYAELGTRVRRSGGTYVYAREAFGNGTGFLFGWADIFATGSSIAFAGLGLMEFAGLLWPSITPWSGVLAASTVVVFTLSQLGGVRFSSVVQQGVTAIKALLFLGLIAGLLLFAAPATESTAAVPAAAPMLPGIVALAFGMQLVLGAYDGWAGGAYFAGEDRDPGRNLPRGILAGVLLVIIIYLLMNIAMLRVLPFETLAASPLPAADAARAWLGDAGARLVTAIAAISLLPLLGVCLMTASRIAHAMACDGLLPAPLARVDRRGTPVTALLCMAAVGLLLIAASGGTLNVVIRAGTLLAVFGYIGGFAALLVLRRRQPHAPGVFRSWGFPYTTWIALAGAIALTLGAFLGAPGDNLIAMIVLAISYPAYQLTRRVAQPEEAGA
jgi:APA family basic amino acid/polyamine antiporter